MSRAMKNFELPNVKRARAGALVLALVHSAFAILALGKIIAGDADWLTWVSLVMNGGCAWFRMWQLGWFAEVNRARAQGKAASKTPAIDPRLFMPYSTCPKCGVEALHWLGTAPPIFLFGDDVARECRDCGHIWSQKVGCAE